MVPEPSLLHEAGALLEELGGLAEERPPHCARRQAPAAAVPELVPPQEEAARQHHAKHGHQEQQHRHLLSLSLVCLEQEEEEEEEGEAGCRNGGGASTPNSNSEHGRQSALLAVVLGRRGGLYIDHHRHRQAHPAGHRGETKNYFMNCHPASFPPKKKSFPRFLSFIIFLYSSSLNCVCRIDRGGVGGRS